MEQVIVLGLAPQGLSVLRVLTRAGIKVVAYYGNKRNVGRYSRYGEKIFFEDMVDLKHKIKGQLTNLTYKPLCYITSGEILATVLRDFPELYQWCRVISGPYETIKTLAHKDLMYEIAQAKGFRVANYATLDKFHKGDLTFPLFMKRNYEIPLFFKAAFIPEEQTLDAYLARIQEAQKKDILIQEYISIPKDRLKEISVQAFFSKGRPKGFLFGYQEDKLTKGLTALLQEIDDKELCRTMEKLCCQFMKELGYTGFVEFEFMYDKETRELFFIEVNTRTCGEHSSLNYKFSNLVEVLRNPFEAPELQVRSQHVKWMNIQRDIRARLQKKYFTHLSNFFTSSYDIWDVHDLKPFFGQFL